MTKVAIITDSIACLTSDLVERYGIGIIPINFYSDGKVYHDWVDITPSQAYDLFLQDPKSFRTSAASPAYCLNVYREISKRADQILCVTVSSKLSTVYNVALGAKEQAAVELPSVRIEVVDSQMATAGEGLIALAAARAAAEGKDLAEVRRAAEEVKQKVSVFVLLDTVRYVYRSGRIPKIAAYSASVLNIRPLLAISSGVVKFNGAVRNRAHGIDRILKIMRSKVGSKPVHVAVVHAYALDEAKKLTERIAAEFNCAELWLAEFSPVMGYACGTGALGVAFYPES